MPIINTIDFLVYPFFDGEAMSKGRLERIKHRIEEAAKNPNAISMMLFDWENLEEATAEALQQKQELLRHAEKHFGKQRIFSHITLRQILREIKNAKMTLKAPLIYAYGNHIGYCVYDRNQGLIHELEKQGIKANTQVLRGLGAKHITEHLHHVIRTKQPWPNEWNNDIKLAPLRQRIRKASKHISEGRIGFRTAARIGQSSTTSTQFIESIEKEVLKQRATSAQAHQKTLERRK